MKLIIAALVFAVLAVPSSSANASVVHHVSWDARTCSAVERWEAHPTQARLARIAYYSVYATERTVGADSWSLISDVRHAQAGDRTSAAYVSDDEAFLYQDCHQDGVL